MKRLFAFALVMIFAFSLCACKSNKFVDASLSKKVTSGEIPQSRDPSMISDDSYSSGNDDTTDDTSVTEIVVNWNDDWD